MFLSIGDFPLPCLIAGGYHTSLILDPSVGTMPFNDSSDSRVTCLWQYLPLRPEVVHKPGRSCLSSGSIREHHKLALVIGTMPPICAADGINRTAEVCGTSSPRRGIVLLSGQQHETGFTPTSHWEKSNLEKADLCFNHIQSIISVGKSKCLRCPCKEVSSLKMVEENELFSTA